MSAGPSFTRRHGLTALALIGPAGLLVACSGDPAPDEPQPTPSPTSVTDRTVASERELVALYAAVAAAFPDIAQALGAIGSQHAAHARALTGSDAVDGPTGASPTPIAVPATRSAALDLLVASERRAQRERLDACVAAAEPGLARTLAFVGASEASHIPALRELRG
jgi:hypothetical protein